MFLGELIIVLCILLVVGGISHIVRLIKGTVDADISKGFQPCVPGKSTHTLDRLLDDIEYALAADPDAFTITQRKTRCKENKEWLVCDIKGAHFSIVDALCATSAFRPDVVIDGVVLAMNSNERDTRLNTLVMSWLTSRLHAQIGEIKFPENDRRQG